LASQLRQTYTSELDQLKLQVEVMGVRVDENLERMREVLRTGDARLAALGVNADDDIDAMNVSLTERCYDLLRREAPVASDLRVVVSVVRMLTELERVGDLALRVMKLAPDHALLSSHDAIADILSVMADQSIESYRLALRAWSTEDLAIATQLAAGGNSMGIYRERLTAELLRLSEPDAVAVALVATTAGQAFDRIADHASIMGARLRYLITGDPDHLAAEVR
jgi:phosphate transport system protein